MLILLCVTQQTFEDVTGQIRLVVFCVENPNWLNGKNATWSTTPGRDLPPFFCTS